MIFSFFSTPTMNQTMFTSLTFDPPLSPCVPTSISLLCVCLVHTYSTIATLHPSMITLQIPSVYSAILTLHVCLLSPTHYMSALFTYLELQVCPLAWYFPPYMFVQKVEHRKHMQPTFC
jgi:hypothetical protein